MKSILVAGVMCGGLWSVGVCGGVGCAEPPAEGQIVKADAPVINPEAQAVVERAMKAYRALDSYADKRVGQKVVKGSKRTGEPLKENHEPFAMSFTWSKDGRFVLRGPQAGVHGDGTWATIWVNGPEKGQKWYVRTTFEKRAELPSKTQALRVLYSEHALLRPLGGFDDSPLMRYRSLESVKPAERNGVKGREVAGTCTSTDSPDDVVPMTMFFADDTGFLLETRVDETAIYNRHYKDNFDGDRVFTEVSFTDKYTEIRTNFKPGDAEFVFETGAKTRELTKLNSFSDGEDPKPSAEDLVGKPAPSWTAKDFAGTEVSLSEFKDKIVLMDFWASWCGPCVKALPSIEELRQKYEPKGVVFLGMNSERDEAGLDKAKKILAEKSIGIRQVRASRKVMDAYRIDGIPHLVIIDGKGVLRVVHSGFGPTTAKEISEKLDALTSATER